jgi:hypothetical protein
MSCNSLPPIKLTKLALVGLLLASAVASGLYADHPTLSLEDGRPGPVTTIPAIPLPGGMASTGVQSQFLFTREISDADLLRYTLLDEHVHSTESLASVSFTGAYGFTDDLTGGFALPYIWRQGFRDVVFPAGPPGSRERPQPRHGGHAHGGGGGGGNAAAGRIDETDFDGLGDALLYGQYRFLRDEAMARHAALLFGLKTPTGRTDVKKADGSLIESDHQPGSGSWDPLLGFAFTQQAGRWSFDLNGLYSFVNDGAGATNRGDIANYNLALSYRVFGANGEDACEHDHHDHARGPKEIAAPHSHDHGGGASWDLIFEVNGDWRDKVTVGGMREANTGGNVLFLSLGSRVTLPQGWTASASAGLPAAIDLNGIQSEPRMRLLFGVARSF